MSERLAALRASILAAHSDLVAAAKAIGPRDWLRPSPNEGWTAKDTLAHLSSIEVRIREQIECAVAGKPWVAVDVHLYNAQQLAERATWPVEQLLAELEDERRATLAVVDRLRDQDLDRQFDHPTRGRVTVERILRIIPEHLRAHGQDIAAACAGG